MSHLATIKTEIKDIKALGAACKELGFEFHEGKITHGLWNGKKAPCSHAISHKSWAEYDLEVGLIQTPTGYTLSFDDMLQHWTDKNCKTPVNIGKGASRLLQMYGVHKATMEARKQGWMVQRRSGLDGSVKLVCSGM